MKPFISVLFDVFGFVLKVILLFTLLIIGIDLINKNTEEKAGSKVSSQDE